MNSASYPAQVFFWLAGGVFWLVSIYQIVRGFRQYKASVQQRAAESLMKLEERFATLSDITWLIDPESKMYERERKEGGLASAVKKSLEGRQLQRTPDEDKKGVLLDQLLRFLLLVSRVEKDKLLDLEALKYMYHYWFEAVASGHQYDLRCYVKLYFKNLNAFLDNEFPLADNKKKDFEEQWRKHEEKRAAQASPQQIHP